MLRCRSVAHRLVLSVIIATTPLYFMAGFAASASSYFFYVLVVFLTCSVFVSIAMVCAAAIDSLAVSGVFTSTVMPLFVLFAGVYITKPQVSGTYVCVPAQSAAGEAQAAE